MSAKTIERIIGKLETLSASDIVELESILDGYVSESQLSPEMRQAMEDVEKGNVTKCESLDQLFRELEI